MEPEAQGNGSSVRKTIIWLVVLVLIVGGLVVYGSKGGDDKEVASKEPIKIGVLAPLTGDGAVYGEPARNLYQMVVDDINAAGGINGQTLTLVVEDGKCNGKDATSAVQKLIEVDKVQVIVGGICSGETIPSVAIAEAKKVVMFSPGASSPDLTGISPYFFRNYPSDAAQGRVLAEVAFNQKKWKTVAFLQEQTEYAVGIYKSFSSTFEALGGKVIKEETASGSTDFRSQLTKLKAAKADALFVDTQTPAMSARVFKQMQDLKWKPAILLNDVTGGDPATVAEYKDLLEGALTAQVLSDESNPKLQKMATDYVAKYGAEVPYKSSYAPTEYDALYIIRDAILAVGYDGEKIAQWSRTIKDWDGASGKVTIESTGDRIGGHTAEVIKDGKAEVLK